MVAAKCVDVYVSMLYKGFRPILIHFSQRSMNASWRQLCLEVETQQQFYTIMSVQRASAFTLVQQFEFTLRLIVPLV